MPEWLPEKVCVDPWTAETYNVLYGIFCRDIRGTDIYYRGYSVWIFREIDDGREKIFWHLTTREVKPTPIPRRKRRFYPKDQTHIKGDRYPDFRRCERLPWVKPLIENPGESEIVDWDYEEGDRTIRTYVWLKDHDFVVIMKKYPDNKRRLITSFYVDQSYKRKDFERKYEQRIK